METKYFVDKDGNYIGGFSGAEPPKNSIEVPNAPNHAWQKYDILRAEWLPLTEDQKAILGE